MKQTKLKLAFAGTPEIAATVLKSLVDSKQHELEVVLTQPDRPAGRGRKLTPSEVKKVACEHGIPVWQPQTSTELETVQLQHCDLMLVVAYGLLIPPSVLTQPRLACINIHTSLLPRWRGAAPIQRAIEAGDKKTGISFMQMDEGLDTGDILEQLFCPIEPQDTAGKLHDRLATIAADNINAFLTKLAHTDRLPRVKQDNTTANYAAKISKQDAKIDWHIAAVEIERKIRAFNPFPIMHTKINDLNIRVWEATVKSSNVNLKPGTVLDNQTSLDIMTGQNVLSISKLQLAGRRAMSAKEFLNGHGHLFDSKPIAN